jgi:hypothetical protein
MTAFNPPVKAILAKVHRNAWQQRPSCLSLLRVQAFNQNDITTTPDT